MPDPSRTPSASLALAGRIALEPFIERRPMATINSIFDELHHGPAKGRLVLIPEAAR